MKPLVAWLERRFDLYARGTTLRREVLGGLTTFMTMGYILFANPAILCGVADPRGTTLAPAAVLTSTALVAALATALMGLLADVPLALAAGMGLNAVVAWGLVGGLQLTWPEAMGVIVVEGAAILLLVLSGLREAVFHALPDPLKRGIAVGIGLFLTLIGLVNAGFVTRPAAPDAPPVQLGAGGHLTGWPALVFVLGFLLTAALLIRKVRGAFLLGIAGTTALAIAVNASTGGTAWPAPVARLPERLLVAPDLSLLGSFSFEFVTRLGATSAALTVLAVMLSDFFDTMGTVIAVGQRAGFVSPTGDVPRARPILMVDSLAAILGGLSSSSSATSYIESASGVAAGGRTGLTALVCAGCFLLSVGLAPLAGLIPPQATAPVLVLVGFLMLTEMARIPWEEPLEAIPAFLALVVMPFTWSITNGIGAGVVAHAALRTLAGRPDQVHPLLWACAAAFVLHFVRM